MRVKAPSVETVVGHVCPLVRRSAPRSVSSTLTSIQQGVVSAMKSSVTRSAVALVAVAAFLAGCSDDSDSSDATTDTTATATAEESKDGGAGGDGEATPQDTASPTEVEVLDITYVQLPTAIDTLGLRGLEAKAVDADGNEVTPDDETTWLVVDQDPIEGVVPVGTVVTLTVEKQGS